MARRIVEAYERLFQQILARRGSHRAAAAARRLVGRARAVSRRDDEPLASVLARSYDRARVVARRREGQEPTGPAAAGGAATPAVRFACDAGLGGLARWLRAAGYEASWIPDIGDDDLIAAAHETGAVLLTTDTLLMRRGVLRDGVIPALWVPPTLRKREQARMVLRELALPLREPRCMACGGALRPVAKEDARDRIPPRTYLWRDDYFECGGCGKLYWRGTHWARIRETLERGPLSPESAG
jgi:uncharacterized protein with PIN domain